MANALAVELHASAAEVADGQSAVDIGTLRSAIRLQLDVTDVSGATPSLIVTIETSPSGGVGGWRAVGSFPAITAAGNFPSKTFAELERYVRARWAITGATPSFTFSLAGHAHVLYARPSDIGRYALAAQAFATVGADVQADACLRATDDADAALNCAFVLPLTAWPEDLRGRCADIAAFYAMKHRGFRPGGADELIVKAYDDATTWLNRIANGRLSPPGIVDSTPEVYEAGAYVVSKAKRGW